MSNIATKSNYKASPTNKWLWLLLIVLIVVPYVGLVGMKMWYDKKTDQIRNAKFIVINKESMKLMLFDYRGSEISSYGISCGKNYGQKMKIGDMKTPEGVFHISDIEEASTWKHDFKDGRGKIEGAYGPWFLRIEVPGHKGIGIHGTHKPESIYTRDTEGCIRLRNEDIEDLRLKVNIGMVVIILPSAQDSYVTRKDSVGYTF